MEKFSSRRIAAKIVAAINLGMVFRGVVILCMVLALRDYSWYSILSSKIGQDSFYGIWNFASPIIRGVYVLELSVAADIVSLFILLKHNSKNEYVKNLAWEKTMHWIYLNVAFAAMSVIATVYDMQITYLAVQTFGRFASVYVFWKFFKELETAHFYRNISVVDVQTKK